MNDVIHAVPQDRSKRSAQADHKIDHLRLATFLVSMSLALKMEFIAVCGYTHLGMNARTAS
jgi:hypothetical protein